MYCIFFQIFAGIGAKRSRFEDLSIQLQHIDEHKRTAEHKDECNFMRIGYTKTVVALCFTVNDAEGLMWSVKLIGNSWVVTGSWEGNVYELPPIFTSIHCQMEQLDHYLDGMMQEQRESGGYQYHKRVTSQSIHNLVLDHECHWEEFCLGSKQCDQKKYAVSSRPGL
jgi:hypothetical protein